MRGDVASAPMDRVPLRRGSAVWTQRPRRKSWSSSSAWSLAARPGYRIYLVKDGEALIVLLGGGTKRRQQSDIARAKALDAEYKATTAAVRWNDEKMQKKG